MTYLDYLLHLFYLIDTELKALNLPRLRQRGPRPRLHDSEVITMELAGEFLGIDTDKGIWAHFRRHHVAEFPLLARISGPALFAKRPACGGSNNCCSSGFWPCCRWTIRWRTRPCG